MPNRRLPRISVYVPSLMGGGAERAAAVLASGFHAAGCEVRLLVDVASQENRAFLDGGMPVVELGAGHAASLRALARHLRQGHEDVVLAVGGAANIKLVAAQALARSRIPIVLSYHGRSDVGRGRLGWAAFALAAVLTRRAAHTVCVSESLVRHLVGDWKAAAGRVTCIPNAIPVDQARPALSAAELQDRPALIIAAGRLVPEKDFGTLVRAFATLPADTRLTILGEGPERETLEAMAERAGVRDRLSLPGYVPEPWTAYAQARVFALSSASEGFGNVVAEALASGLPVVSTDCGGPREILEGGRWGILVPVGDPVALATALGNALERPGDPAPRVLRAARYETRRIVQDYLALFGRIIGEGGVQAAGADSPG